MRSGMVLFISGLLSTSTAAEDCRRGKYDALTDDWYLSVSSAQGAVGDVIGVDVSIVVENPRKDLAYAVLYACYDSAVLEPVGDPEPTEAYDRLVWRTVLEPIQTGPESLRGLGIAASFIDAVAEAYFPNQEPIHLFTLYFRIKGQPGTATSVAFCDDTFNLVDWLGRGVCRANTLAYLPKRADAEQLPWVDARSTRHTAGEVRVLEGAPTQPDRPPSAPLAKVYETPPTAETADILFEMTGAAARPGSQGVPVDVYVTSNYEFSGFILNVTFPSRYVSVSSVAEHVRPGAIHIDNEAGHVAVALLSSRRRIAFEGERVRLVTLYFDIQPEALEVEQVLPSFDSILKPNGTEYHNYLVIHHQGGEAGDLPVKTDVSPLVTSDGLLMIQRQPTYLGDVNFDFRLDLSDAVAILEHLFLEGDSLYCPTAADFTLDGRVNITDPVAILQHLFQGGANPDSRPTVFCDE